MTIEDLLSYLTTTAAVVGYFVMLLFVVGLSWMTTVWHEEWAYRRRRRRKNDLREDNRRSQWLDEYIPILRTDTVERPAVHPDRVDTDEIPDFHPDRITTDVMDYTIDQIVTYQKEHGQ